MTFNHSCNVHCCGKTIVARLPSIHIIVWMDRFVTNLSTNNLDSSVCDYLVDIHVSLSSRTCLPDYQRELIIKFSRNYFISSLHDCLCFVKGEIPFFSERPYFKFTRAAHFFKIPKARMIGLGIRSVSRAISKFWIDLCVWAPHSFSLGTRIVPIVSFSYLNSKLYGLYLVGCLQFPYLKNNITKMNIKFDQWSIS